MGGDRGGGSAEAAIAWSGAFLLIWLLVQILVGLYARHVAHGTADVALAAARSDGATVEQARAEAAALQAQLGDDLLVDPTILVERTDTQATVRVQGTAATVFPGLRIPVRIELSAPIDRFIVDPGPGG